MPTYIPTYLCDSSDGNDNSDSSDRSDSSEEKKLFDKNKINIIKKNFTNTLFNQHFIHQLTFVCKKKPSPKERKKLPKTYFTKFP